MKDKYITPLTREALDKLIDDYIENVDKHGFYKINWQDMGWMIYWLRTYIEEKAGE